MTTIAPSAERQGGIWTDDYCLRHCEGYAVDDADGRRLGYVETVVRQDGAPEPLELAVRLCGGTGGVLVVPCRTSSTSTRRPTGSS